MIDITGLPKAEVLAALHNATKAIGMGMMHDIGRDMTIEEAQACIDTGAGETTARVGQYRFDYVNGRPLKVDITGDAFDPTWFDRDAGQGAAQRAIDAIR